MLYIIVVQCCAGDPTTMRAVVYYTWMLDEVYNTRVGTNRTREYRFCGTQREIMYY